MKGAFLDGFDNWVANEHSTSYLRVYSEGSGEAHFHGPGRYAVRHLAYPNHEILIGQLNPVVLSAEDVRASLHRFAEEYFSTSFAQIFWFLLLVLLAGTVISWRLS